MSHRFNNVALKNKEQYHRRQHQYNYRRGRHARSGYTRSCNLLHNDRNRLQLLTVYEIAYADEPYDGYNYDWYGDPIPSQNGYVVEKVVTGKDIGPLPSFSA